MIDHSGRDDKLHLYEHAEKTGHGNVNIHYFEILSNGYRNNKFKRKLAEPLHIKHERPTLNVQEQSVPLKLFNRQSTEVVRIGKLLRWSFFVKSVNCFSCELFSKKAPSMSLKTLLTSNLANHFHNVFI